MSAGAYCIHRRFEIAGPAAFCMDRHYFIYALSGTMRLEAEGMQWMLTPARGALIKASQPVTVTILSPVTTASFLFGTDLMRPGSGLSVFDLSPLCRELVRACKTWDQDREETEYSRALFPALAAETARLAESPVRCLLPMPVSEGLRRAMALTEESINSQPDFVTIAKAAGHSPRTLARRFSKEMGMTWRETVRRLRVLKAIELLAVSNASITQVSLSVGYASLSAFNAAFHEYVGIPPGEYRSVLARM